MTCDWSILAVLVLCPLAVAQWVALRFWRREYARERRENTALRGVCVDADLVLEAYQAIDRARAEHEAQQ